MGTSFFIILLSQLLLSDVRILVTANSNADESSSGHKSAQHLPPIILIPGSQASKIYAKNTNNSYEKIWIKPGFAIGNETQKANLFQQLSLIHNQKFAPDSPNYLQSRTEKLDTLGVNEFGSLEPTICLFSDFNGEMCKKSIADKTPDANLAPLANWLVANLGYTLGVNLFAAPYDWRFQPTSVHLDPFYKQLKGLIENAVLENDNKRAYIVAHSMGNSIAQVFLNEKVDQNWQIKNVAATINVAPVFGGAVEAIEELLSGNPQRYFDTLAAGMDKQTVLQWARSLGSIPAFLPNKLAYPDPKNAKHRQKQTFVKFKGKEYTLDDKDMNQLLAFTEIAHLYPIYKNSLNSTMKPPKVTEMHCIYGTAVDTPLHYTYSDSLDHPPEVTNGKGDGTINIESLRVCQKWKNEQGNKVGQIMELNADDVNHASIISDVRLFQFIESIVQPPKE